MNTNQLIAFTTVVQTGSFTKAAASLNCSQPTITTRIKTLEFTLGVDLFRRLPHGIQMTSAGVDLLPFARNIITLTDKAHRAIGVNGEPHGRLRIGTAQSLTEYRLVPLIEYMFWRHPDVQIALRSCGTGENLASVHNGQFDGAFFTGPVEPHEDLETTVLCPEPLCVVSGRGHALAGRREVTIEDLSGATFVRAEYGSGYHDQLELELGPPESQISVLDLDSIVATKRAVSAGIGIALLPEVAVAAELRDETLHKLPWTPQFRVFTQFAWRKHDWSDPTVAALLSGAARVISEQVSDLG